MATTHGTATRTAVADLVAARCVLIRIYSGAVPANAAASIGAATQLVELTCNATPAAPAVAGVATFNATTQSVGATAGTATFTRGIDSNGNAVFQGTVTVSGGGGDAQMSTTTIAAGLFLTVSSITYTAPV